MARERPRWYSSWAPGWLKGALRPFWSDRITEDDLKNEMDAALQLPGISNAWTMPIRGRLDMLSTGIRTPVGIKISGADLGTIEKTAQEIEAVVQKVPGTRSVYAERVAGGYFLDFVLKREQLAQTKDPVALALMRHIKKALDPQGLFNPGKVL